jgi:hypothetical protein
MDSSKQIGRYQEYGLLDPSISLSYKKNVFTKNQTLWFTTKYSQSMGPKIQKTLANGTLQSTSRVGYSFSENTLSYDNSEYPLGFGANLTYRSNYMGKKRKNDKLIEFDPEKWVTTGANIYYPFNKYTIGTSTSIYRPADLNGRDYHNKLIGILSNSIDLCVQYSKTASFYLSLAESREDLAQMTSINVSENMHYHDNYAQIGMDFKMFP